MWNEDLSALPAATESFDAACRGRIATRGTAVLQPSACSRSGILIRRHWSLIYTPLCGRHNKGVFKFALILLTLPGAHQASPLECLHLFICVH